MKINYKWSDELHEFELDAGAVELKSTSQTKICLPYHGPLPYSLADATSTEIRMSVSRTHPLRAELYFVFNHLHDSYHVTLDRSDVRDIFYRLLEDTSNSGLNDTARAMYLAYAEIWDGLLFCPENVVSMVLGLGYGRKELEYIATGILS